MTLQQKVNFARPNFGILNAKTTEAKAEAKCEAKVQ
jgi:hypothetical protein